MPRTTAISDGKEITKSVMGIKRDPRCSFLYCCLDSRLPTVWAEIDAEKRKREDWSTNLHVGGSNS